MPAAAASLEAVTGQASAPAECDLAVVGGGILGLAVARELKSRHPGLSTVVLEAADRVGTGQTGSNSGVIHAGIYYAPGSLKARMCVAGARAMYELCERRGIAYDRCGKLIVARDERELPALDELERRGRENEVPGLRRLGRRRDRRGRAALRGRLRPPLPRHRDRGLLRGGARAGRGPRRAGGPGRHRLRR